MQTFRFTSLVGIVGLCCSSAAFSSSLIVDANGDSFGATLEAAQRENRFNVSAGFLTTEDKGNLFNLGMFTTGKLNGVDNIYGGLGVRLYYADLENAEDTESLALGGFLDIGLPIPELSVTTHLFYAPSITTTRNYESLIDFSARVNYKVFENAEVFVGLRDIEVADENSNDLTINDGLFVGFELDL